MRHAIWRSFGIVAFALAATVFARPASAHPHVWVTMQTTVLYEGGRISGFEHVWTFDDAYTAMAIEGLDTNKDGDYSRDELKDLAKVNIDGLKEFNYFTYAKLGDAALAFVDPTEYYLDYKNNLLSLHFKLPLKEPVPADAKGFSFSVYDETFFIAFDFVPENGVTLGPGAPPGCKASTAIPENELEQLNALNKAFGGELTSGNKNQGMGSGYAKTVTLACAP